MISKNRNLLRNIRLSTSHTVLQSSYQEMKCQFIFRVALYGKNDIDLLLVIKNSDTFSEMRIVHSVRKIVETNGYFVQESEEKQNGSKVDSN